MYIPKYFTYAEVIHSNTAVANNLPNNPNSFKDVLRLSLLCKYLDKVRETLGKPIVVNCGFRSKKVNEFVGGSPTSLHLYGLAADVHCSLPPESLRAVACSVLDVPQLVPTWSKTSPSWCRAFENDKFEIIEYHGFVHIGIQFKYAEKLLAHGL